MDPGEPRQTWMDHLIIHKYSSEFVYFLLDSSTQKSIPYKSVGMGDCQGMDTVREHSYSGYGGVLGRII